MYHFESASWKCRYLSVNSDSQMLSSKEVSQKPEGFVTKSLENIDILQIKGDVEANAAKICGYSGSFTAILKVQVQVFDIEYSDSNAAFGRLFSIHIFLNETFFGITSKKLL